MHPEHHVELVELAEAILTGLTSYGRKGVGQALDCLIYAAIQCGIDPRSELPKRLSRLRRQGLIPHLRSTRPQAVKEANARAERAARAAAMRHLEE